MRSPFSQTRQQLTQTLDRPALRSLGFRLAIALLVFVCLAPILWQCLTSVKVNADIAALPNVYLPKRFTFAHYTELFTRRPFWSYLINSAIVAVSSTGLALGLGAPAAYALARLKLPGERFILGMILIVTLFPYILLFFGLLEIVQKLGWGNQYLALIVPYTAINLPLTILVLRSFFLQLPPELEDAARVDGYGTLAMFWQIILPMTTPALVTTGILTFIFAWNEFIFALTFITQESLKTIPIAASQIGGASVFEIPYGPIAAATVLGTFPLVILVLLFQRRIIGGLTTGAVKG
jgi:multiple sugar transport system permease protein